MVAVKVRVKVGVTVRVYVCVMKHTSDCISAIHTPSARLVGDHGVCVYSSWNMKKCQELFTAMDVCQTGMIDEEEFSHFFLDSTKHMSDQQFQELVDRYSTILLKKPEPPSLPHEHKHTSPSNVYGYVMYMYISYMMLYSYNIQTRAYMNIRVIHKMHVTGSEARDCKTRHISQGQ